MKRVFEAVSAEIVIEGNVKGNGDPLCVKRHVVGRHGRRRKVYLAIEIRRMIPSVEAVVILQFLDVIFRLKVNGLIVIGS